MELCKIVQRYDIEFSALLPNDELIREAEKLTGVKFGRQLTEYLREYGYIGYREIEFYGINPKQKTSSDLIKQTIYLHDCFISTNGFVAIENRGDGDYTLVDSYDQIYVFQTENSSLIPFKKTMFEYIEDRLSHEL